MGISVMDGLTLCSSPGWPSTAGRPTTAAGTCCRQRRHWRRHSRCAYVTVVANGTWFTPLKNAVQRALCFNGRLTKCTCRQIYEQIRWANSLACAFHVVMPVLQLLQ